LLLIVLGLVSISIAYIFLSQEYKGAELSSLPETIVAKNTKIDQKPFSGTLKSEPGLKSLDATALGTSMEGTGAKSAETSAGSRPAGAGAPGDGSRASTSMPAKAPSGGVTEPPAIPAEPIKPAPTPLPHVPPIAEKLVTRTKVVKGEAFTKALIKAMDDQVNRTFWGWRPNSILFGKLGLTDDVNNLQLGVLEVARRTVVVLNENMSRFALTEAQNPFLNNSMNFFMVSPEKYWFPSASGKYKEAMENLERYIDDLKHNRSRFYTRVDNLIALMTHFRDVLGSAFHNLIKDTEADGSSVSWFVCDDYFYFAQGVAQGMADILEGVKEDFADQLAKKNSSNLVGDAIHALHAAAHLHPWLITDAAKDGFLANHRANMATYVGEAEHIIFTLINVLATN
jgi:hypothetical protein